MSIESIIAKINVEIDQLQRARALLAGSGEGASKLVSVGSKPEYTGKKRGPKPGSKRAVTPGKKRRTLSPEARLKIAEAQRRRWAAQKTATKLKNK